ncbi:MAG: competence/damage-inducible protein A [Candidatus Metalachnospira sp.]|nr:competence/damage-inducible protein A [Candidatus Metalachnospira sp.]
MNAEILAVGTELLLGDIVNTNAQYIAQGLAELGIDVYYQTVVGDNPERLKSAIHSAFDRADIIITTGGLGPTEDDLTKEIGAQYFGRKLVLDERALDRIKKFFDKMKRPMTDNNVKQAMVPENAVVMYNANGTAPGIIIENEKQILIMMPGPPREMKPMFSQQVKPYLASKQEYTLVSRVLRIAGVGESAMEMQVKDLIASQTNPTVAPYAKDVEAVLRITARAENADEAEKIIEPVAQEIYSRFGKSVYAEGETSMQETVAQMLVKRNKTIAVAESCTGGLVASRLIEYPGISSVLLEGAVTYSNEAKMRRLGVKRETLEAYGAVSAETAVEMAEGIAKSSGASIGLSTTGVAGPGPSEGKPEGLVFIGVYIEGKTYVKELNLAGKRNVIRERAAYNALDYLRRKLMLD